MTRADADLPCRRDKGAGIRPAVSRGRRVALDVPGQPEVVLLHHDLPYSFVAAGWPLRADVPADPAGRLHAAPIAPADLVQRVTDLPQRAMADGFNQDFEHVSAIDRHLPQLRQPGRTLRSIACVEIAQARQLAP